MTPDERERFRAIIVRMVLKVVCFVVGTTLLGQRFGWKMGVAVGVLVYILIPYTPPPPRS